LVFFSAQRDAPIIVKIVEEPHDPTGLAAVLVGALGLTGAILVAALTLGVIVGGLMYLLRSRQPLH
jgi:hypothetical protein